jgi:hypothetical protein
MKAPKPEHDALAGVATGISFVHWFICCSEFCTSNVILGTEWDRRILQVTQRISDFLEKLTVAQLLKAIPAFMEVKRSFPGNTKFLRRTHHLIGHSKRETVYVHVCYSKRFPTQSYFTVQYTVQCTDKQHAMSSHELQSALMLTVDFSKMYYTR